MRRTLRVRQHQLGNNPPPPPTAKALDTFYGFDSSTRYDDENAQQIYSFNEIEDAVKKIGPEILERQFLAVYEEIKNVLNASGRGDFPSLIFRRKWFSIHRHFQVVFIVFYELLVKENMKIDDYKNVAGKLDGIGDRIMNIKSTGGFWNAESRQDNINAVIGVMKDKFTKRLGNDPALDCWKTQLQNLLMQSYTEQAQYDFKIGLHRLDDKGDFDKDLLHKVFKTLTAMANHGPGNVGYVIIGIADKEEDAKRFKSIYGSDPINYEKFHITGVEEEANKHHKSVDAYFRKITQDISSEPIPDEAKNQISRDMRLVRYDDKCVLVLKIESGREPYMYDEELYERHGNTVAKVESKHYSHVYQRFFVK